MRFSARSKVGGLLSLFVMITIVSAFSLNGLFFHAASTHAAGGQSTSSTTGILTPARSVDDSNSTNTLLSRGVRHPQQKKNQTSVGPSATSTLLGTSNSGNLLQKFNGTSSLDSEKTNFGLEFEPPDQGLCLSLIHI